LPAGDAPAGGWPAAIVLSGYQGFRDIHPARFARSLNPRGIAVFGFDFRGFGGSGGTPGCYDPAAQVDDTISAVNFLETCDEIDAASIVLLGWAMGGSVAIAAAADDERPRAVATVNAVGHFERALRNLHTAESWRRLLVSVALDRHRRARVGWSTSIDPFEVIKLDPVTERYVSNLLYEGAEHRSREITLESIDCMRRFRPEEVIGRIAPRPLLLVHGEDNRLHLPTESKRLYDRAREARRLVLIEHAGHTEWMRDEHETYQTVADIIGDFFADALGMRPTA